MRNSDLLAVVEARGQRRADRRPNSRERHGMVNTPEYRSWVSMRQRCYDRNCAAYPHYGGRGIVVCDRWNEAFSNFYADMGPRPKGTSLDRIDNDGPYTPENCRWATRTQQSRNTRRSAMVVIDGQKLPACDVAEQNNITIHAMHQRMRMGWTPEQSVGLTEHFDPRSITIDGESRTLTQWAKHLGISRQAIYQRIHYGWTIEQAITTPKCVRGEKAKDTSHA